MWHVKRDLRFFQYHELNWRQKKCIKKSSGILKEKDLILYKKAQVEPQSWSFPPVKRSKIFPQDTPFLTLLRNAINSALSPVTAAWQISSWLSKHMWWLKIYQRTPKWLHQWKVAAFYFSIFTPNVTCRISNFFWGAKNHEHLFTLFSVIDKIQRIVRIFILSGKMCRCSTKRTMAFL